MIHNLLGGIEAVPYVGLLTAVAVHLRQLALLTGFLVALRGVRGRGRNDMFEEFARHLTGRPGRRP
ncbi:hypothetical protein [Kitasatospora sp. NPDC059327]|uniref:hypothetical protein n=1 Tax=Kitasatospora sp. NPDC059327 TaxID=3346803 RepID=UPI003680A6D4